jgi:hypothetical protein
MDDARAIASAGDIPSGAPTSSRRKLDDPVFATVESSAPG